MCINSFICKMENKDLNRLKVVLAEKKKTKLPITNAEDIDHYLEGLRQQLLKLLVDHDGVMITK